MKKFNLKEHNQNIKELTTRAFHGTYPNKKIAKTGSYIGSFVGFLLAIVGLIEFLLGAIWGIGCLLAGIITIISNIFNLKRIR